MVQDVPVPGLPIRLGQFLKLANLIESGSEARPVLASEAVRVNGEVETRRGRQLALGDTVALGGIEVRVADSSAGDGLPW